MKTKRVCCQGCGANLEVDETIRFVTCNYCDARLEVVHDQTTTHTKLLDELVEKTESMAGDLKVIQAEMELQRVERDWEIKQKQFMVTDKHGRESTPSMVGSVIGGIIVIIFGVFWIGLAASMNAPPLFPLFGLVFIGAAVFGLIKGATKSTGYQNALAEYQTRRAAAVRRLEEARREGD
jgi:hypothetical protein